MLHPRPAWRTRHRDVGGVSPRPICSRSDGSDARPIANKTPDPVRNRKSAYGLHDYKIILPGPSHPFLEPRALAMQTHVSLNDLGRLVDGHLENASSILGPHVVDYRGSKALAVRSFLPDAEAAWVIDRAGGCRRPMRKLHPAGFFEALCDVPVDAGDDAHHHGDAAASTYPRYRIQMAKQSGELIDIQDPYAVPSILSDFDRYLLGEGKYYRLFESLGAQLREVDGTRGVNFAVWAPNARIVQIVGDFNSWDGR